MTIAGYAVEPSAKGRYGHMFDSFARSEPFQWIDEAYKNAAEHPLGGGKPNATAFVYTFDPVAESVIGARRCVMWDNGIGMDRQLFEGTFETLDVTNKEDGRHFGNGVRILLQPWNQHGVVYITSTKGKDGVVRQWMQIVYWDTEEKILRRHELDDGQGGRDAVGPLQQWEGVDYKRVWFERNGLEEKTTKGRETGFMVVLLGNTGLEQTYDGSPRDRDARAAASGEWLRLYVGTRRWDRLHGMSVYHSWKKLDGTIETEPYGTLREWASSEKRLATPVTNAHGDTPSTSGTIDVDLSDIGLTGRIHWFLHRSKAELTGDFDKERPGYGVLVDHAVYEYVSFKGHTKLVFGTAQGSAARASRLKLSSGIYRRVIIVFEPDLVSEKMGPDTRTDGVFMDVNRTSLSWQHTASGTLGIPLPHDRICDVFAQNLPRSIQDAAAKALQDARRTGAGKIRIDMTKILSRYVRVASSFTTSITESARGRHLAAEADRGTGEPRRSPLKPPRTKASEELVEIRIVPRQFKVPVGGTRDLVAVGVYADRRARTITRKVEWSVTDDAVVSIDKRGTVTGVKVGKLEITAKLSGIVSKPAAAEVVVVMTTVPSTSSEPAGREGERKVGEPALDGTFSGAKQRKALDRRVKVEFLADGDFEMDEGDGTGFWPAYFTYVEQRPTVHCYLGHPVIKDLIDEFVQEEKLFVPEGKTKSVPLDEDDVEHAVIEILAQIIGIAFTINMEFHVKQLTSGEAPEVAATELETNRTAVSQAVLSIIAMSRTSIEEGIKDARRNKGYDMAKAAEQAEREARRASKTPA